MIRPDAADATCPEKANLPRRDWIVLPVLSLLTMCLLGGSFELFGRRMFARMPYSGENCLVLNDALSGAQAIPNCVILEKIPEGKPTQYRFNSSGYRNNADLGPKSPGTYRIVMVGTSVAAGFRVPQEQTMSALLPVELSQRTGRKVEIYNEGLPLRSSQAISHDFKDALAANPDMVLWIVSPLDISYPSSPGDEVKAQNTQNGTRSFLKALLSENSLNASLAAIFSHTRASLLLKNWLYKSPSQYVAASLTGGDYQQDFLQSKTSAEWRLELEKFEKSAASIEDQARKAGVPIVVALVPDRTQAAMISMMSERPNGFDPYKLGHELRSIIESHGGSYIDILPAFRTVPNPQLGYFAIDGHPNADGQAMIARFLSDKLAGLTLPAVRAAAQPQAGLQQSQ